MSCLSEGITSAINSPDGHFSLGYSLTWRDMLPCVDIDIEKIHLNHCSRSMIKECRPSLKSTLFTSLTFGIPIVPLFM